MIMDSLVPEDGRSDEQTPRCRKMFIRAQVNDMTDLDPERLIYGCHYPYLNPKTRNAYRQALLEDIRNGGTQRPDDLHDRQFTIDGFRFECFRDPDKFRQHFCHVALNYLDQDNQQPEPDDKKKIAPPRPPPTEMVTNTSPPESMVTAVDVDGGGEIETSKKNRKRKLPDVDANTRSQRESTCDPRGTSAKINPFGAQIPSESSATGENVQASPPNNTNTIPAVVVENRSRESSRDPVGSPKRKMAEPVKTETEILTNVSDEMMMSEEGFFPPPPIISLNQPTMVANNKSRSKWPTTKPETPPPWMELSDVFARLTPFGWQVFLFKNNQEQYLKINHNDLDYEQLKQLKQGDRMVTVDSRIVVDKFSQIEINYSNDDSEDEDAEAKDAADEDAEEEDDHHKSHDQPYETDGMDFFLANPQIMYMVMNSSNDWKIFDRGPLLIDELICKDQESLETYQTQLQEYYQDQYSIHRDRIEKRKAERSASNFNTDFEDIQMQIAEQKALVPAEQQLMIMQANSQKKPKAKRLRNNNSNNPNPNPNNPHHHPKNPQDGQAQQIEAGGDSKTMTNNTHFIGSIVQSQPSTSKSTTSVPINIPNIIGLKRKSSEPLSPPFVLESVNNMKLLKYPTKFVLRKLTGTPELISSNYPAINGIRIQRIQPKEINNNTTTNNNNVHQKNDKRNPMMMVHHHDDDDDDDVQLIHNP